MFDFFRKPNKRESENVQEQSVPRRAPQKPTPLWLMILNMVLPTVCVLAYLCCGLIADIWHPTWLIFFALPVYYSVGEAIKRRSPECFAYPFIAVAAYLLAGFLGGNVCWTSCVVILLTIPLYYILCAAVKKRRIKLIVDIIVPILCIAAYLSVGFLVGIWHPTWVIFFIVPLYYQTEAAVVKYKKQQQSGAYGEEEVHDKSRVESMSQEEYNRRRNDRY